MQGRVSTQGQEAEEEDKAPGYGRLVIAQVWGGEGRHPLLLPVSPGCVQGLPFLSQL